VLAVSAFAGAWLASAEWRWMCSRGQLVVVGAAASIAERDDDAWKARQVKRGKAVPPICSGWLKRGGAAARHERREMTAQWRELKRQEHRGGKSFGQRQGEFGGSQGGLSLFAHPATYSSVV
jgi:hypothetical protein